MQSISTLPADVQQKLNELKATPADSLTADDIAFLRARSSYLTPDEQIRLGLTKAPVKAESEASEAPVETPAAKPARKTSRAA